MGALSDKLCSLDSQSSVSVLGADGSKDAEILGREFCNI